MSKAPADGAKFRFQFLLKLRRYCCRLRCRCRLGAASGEASPCGLLSGLAIGTSCLMLTSDPALGLWPRTINSERVANIGNDDLRHLLSDAASAVGAPGAAPPSEFEMQRFSAFHRCQHRRDFDVELVEAAGIAPRLGNRRRSFYLLLPNC